MSVAMPIVHLTRTLNVLLVRVYGEGDHLRRGVVYIEPSVVVANAQASPVQSHHPDCGDFEGPSSRMDQSVTRSFAEHEGVLPKV